MKLTRPSLRTKQCCQEHAGEIVSIYPLPVNYYECFATGNEYNKLKVHF